MVAPFAWHTSATYNKVQRILLHTDGLLGEGKRAAQKSVTASEHTDEAIVAFGELVTDADKLIWKFDDSADALTGTIQQVGVLAQAGTGTLNATTATIGKVGDTAGAATERIAALKGQQDAVDALIRQIASHAMPVLDNAAELEDSANTLLADPRNLLFRDHLDATVQHVGTLAVSGSRFLDSGTTLENDVHAHIKPYDGHHPKWHRTFQITGGLVGFGAHGAEAAYYLSNTK